MSYGHGCKVLTKFKTTDRSQSVEHFMKTKFNKVMPFMKMFEKINCCFINFFK